MVMENYDVIIVGSGINSLVSATVLSQAGKTVLVLESRNQIGGQAGTEEFAPGFKCNLINDVIRWIDPRVIKKLNLGFHGLNIFSPELVRITLDRKNKHISFYRDPDKTAASIAKQSEKDAKVWPDFNKYIDAQSQFLASLYEITPPNLPHVGLKDLWTMRSMLKPLRKNGTSGLVDFIRVAAMMMPELMDEWFESKLVRGAVSAAGITLINQGPFSAATGLNLLHQHVHCSSVFHNIHFVKGGLGKLAKTLASSAQSAGTVIRTNAKVDSININDGICSGVRIKNGEEVSANIVLSGLDPTNTFINLIGAEKLDPVFYTQIRNIKYRGSTARVHFALNQLPEIPGVNPEEMNTVFAISPTINYLERAYDVAKYGKIAEKPFIVFTIPTINEPKFAPDGKHVLSATIQYAPYHLKGGSWDNNTKTQLTNNVTQTIGNYIPGFSSLIESSALYTPVDFESLLGLTEGSFFHGDLTLDQFFFMRPTMSSSQYKSPFENLYLCGSGTHPGCGPNGSSGFNAALEVLRK